MTSGTVDGVQPNDGGSVDGPQPNDGGTVDGPCFCRGTLILTQSGETAIQDLAAGDWVWTMSGLQPIRWIGRRSYAGRFLAPNLQLRPVRFKAGALTEGLPRRDLLVSPAHAMYLNGVLVRADKLVNGRSITQDRVDEVEYLHIELPSHEIIWAEGSATETFVDDNSRLLFHNAGEFEQLYPDTPSEPARFCAPRVSEGPELEAIRQQLSERADLLCAERLEEVRTLLKRAAFDQLGSAGPSVPLQILLDGEVIGQVQMPVDGNGRLAFRCLPSALSTDHKAA